MTKNVCAKLCAVVLVLAVAPWIVAALPASGYAEIPETSRIANIDRFLRQCPPEDELEILQRDFTVLYEPANAGMFQLSDCTGNVSRTTVLSDALAVYQALRVIRHMKLSEPLPWTDLHPYEWLKSRIGSIIVSATAQYDHCCRAVDVPGKPQQTPAITIRKASESLLQWRTLWADPQAGVGLDGLVLLIFHEARHVDVPHTCGTGDATLAEMGAWGVQHTIAQWIADRRIEIGTSVSSYYRNAMKASAADALDRICEFDG